MNRNSGAGFTLIEVLVAMAVLALLLVLLLQIVDHTLGSTRAAGRQIETAGEARRALDALESDLRRAVTHGGPAILLKPSSAPVMNALAFLTHGRGPSTGAPRFLAVSYWWDTNSGGTLWRGYSPVPPSASDLLAGATAAWQTASPSPMARGILRGALLFELEDGTLTLNPPSGASVAGGGEFHGATVPAGWTVLMPPNHGGPDHSPRVVAIIAVLAVLDDGALARMDSTALDTARNALPDPTTQAQMRDLVGYWQSLAVGPAFPAPARQSLRAYQKRIPLL